MESSLLEMTESNALFMYHGVHVTMPTHFKRQNHASVQLLWIFLVTHRQMIQGEMIRSTLQWSDNIFAIHGVIRKTLS